MKLALAALAGASYLIARDLLRGTYENQVVMITGGSRGLGFAFASELVGQGAEVVLLARDARELRDACRKLGSRAHAVKCDVTIESDLARAIQTVHQDFGRIDTFIHNAGLISVGPFRSFTDEDFEQALSLHLRTAIHSVRLLQPLMKRGSRIAFISSVGGRVGLPHMPSYSATKFALGGFCESVRPELAADGISLTCVYPGLMRTGSPEQATMKGNAEKEFLWFAAFDQMPLFSMEADVAARKILSAVLDRRSEIIIGWSAKLLTLIRALTPELLAMSMRVANMALPKSESKVGVKGKQARGAFDSSVIAKPLRAKERSARAEWNQH